MKKIWQYSTNFARERATIYYHYNFLNQPQQILLPPTIELRTAAIAWLLEWTIFIQYLYGESQRNTLISTSNVSLALIIALLYWLWLWAMAVWRRTQFGRFTRGERKLWAKALTAFWVAELVTVGSIVLVFVWVSWGPGPLIPRVFMVSRKSFLLELIIYSYILALAYLARVWLHWNSWHSQIVLGSLVLIILSYLLWRDFILLLTRLNLYDTSSARWRNIRTNAVVYTLSHEWWTQHITGTRAAHARQSSLLSLLQAKQRPAFAELPLYNPHELANSIEVRTNSVTVRALCPLLHVIMDYNLATTHLTQHAQPFLSYPRRVGFVPKRLGLWHLLVLLKIWHHLILVLWWTLYVYRLIYRRKTAYNFLNSCAFNIYCCLILAFVVYGVSYLTHIEHVLKARPAHMNFHRTLLYAVDSWHFLKASLSSWHFEHAYLPSHQSMACPNSK